MPDTTADELAIRNLVAEYSDAVNRRDAAAWADTWSTDAAWHILGMSPTGREAIVELWQGLMSSLPFVVQMPSDGTIRLDGDTGTGRFYLTEHARAADGSAMLTLGVYHDRFRRDPDRWRFAERRFHAMYMGPPDLSAEPAGYGGAP